MNPLRLAVGVRPALACSLAIVTLAVGCTDSSRKAPTPREADRPSASPAAPAAAPATADRDTKAAATEAKAPGARPAAPPSSDEDVAAPRAKRDPALGTHEHTHDHHEEEGPLRVPTAAVKGSLEGRDVEGNPRWSCREPRAYRAKAAAVFSDAAGNPLADALNEVAKRAIPMSLIVQQRNGELFAALSATRNNGTNKEAFLPGKEAPFAPLVLAFGSDPTVTTDAPLPRGYVQLFDKKGPVVLELRRLLWKATRGASCDEMAVEVDATIPFAQYGTVLHLAKGDKTIAELAGVAMPDEGIDEDAPLGGADASRRPRRLAVHFSFDAISASFDGGSR